MNWLVCWYVVICVNTECPDFKPDPYTGEMPNAHCAVYHGKTEKIAKTKWFDTKIEANDFISKAPQEIKKRMKMIDATDKPESEAVPPYTSFSDFYKGCIFSIVQASNGRQLSPNQEGVVMTTRHECRDCNWSASCDIEECSLTGCPVCAFVYATDGDIVTTPNRQTLEQRQKRTVNPKSEGES